VSRKKKLKLFLDEGVPDSVGRIFASFGHNVIYLRDAIEPGSPDTLVCAAAEANDAILVACDGDMRELARQHGLGRMRFKKLHLIKLSTEAPRYDGRIKQAMSLIEHEWGICLKKGESRLFIEIQTDVIRTVR
jgi:predicted nuclease of predicted toxin-antitoxin system